MTPVRFCKFHGFGNDYIVVENADLSEIGSLSDLAQAICQRHTAAGADGLAILEKLDRAEADYNCEIVNSDGSGAAFSGNGTRCAVAYLYFKKLWSVPSIRLQTKSGIKNFKLIEEISAGHYVFEAEIGKPLFASDEIPVKTDAKQPTVIDYGLELGEQNLRISAVNVGNPAACIFVDHFDFDWRNLGKELEYHQAFPERANIVFVQVIDRENIELRIWERGAGETSASGTCAAAAAVIGALTDKTNRRVSVLTEGGVTEVLWRDDDEILLTGRADLAYCGEWPA